MPVKLVKGNLLDSDCNVIAHGCNCFNTMGAGIARQIREKYPLAFEADRATKCGDRNKLGHYSFVAITGYPVIIFNLYIQYGYGRERPYLDYDALESALRGMRKHLECMCTDNLCTCFAEGHWKIGMPKIGCGPAGGDWSRVENIIDDVFYDTDIYVYYL